ncbi:LytR/AlgR family response regulator transcription factor [Flexithrix dorotheae]|uniref:LytR/AlgR family response regulator transcription factor n=1 Tax=Flexithrix dorotheae TaxID=70993 RepID=UPI00037174FE|nr:LytTR family DNA-binding domain-containing protein [Flexithrix dorotheae]
MKAIILEDEKHQQELLQDMLYQHFKHIEYVGNAGDIDSGITLINRTKPDLVFLDVILGENTCFELLDRLKKRDFDIIFTTSFEKYAVKAFRLAAIDYLLKPIDIEELKTAILKLNKKAGFDDIGFLMKNMQSLNENLDSARIALPTQMGFVIVLINEIIRCESDNNYTTFFLKNGRKILVSKTLKACENILKDFSFLRVHNTSLINLNYVKEYLKEDGGTVIMEGGFKVNISRRRKDEFLRLFSNIKL